MMAEEKQPESFKDFKDSFFYGTRTDLNFKFLELLSEAEAGDFIQALFRNLADSFDDGNREQVYDLVFQTQKEAYSRNIRWVYNDTPHHPLKKPLSEANLMLLTSSGHFVEGDDPKPFGIENMTQEQAMTLINDFLRTEPTLSEIPINTSPENLRVRHGGYDIRAALQDHNVNFPLKTLLRLRDEGTIGKFNPTAFSFVGACAQTPLKNRVAPKWVERFKQDQVDAALLVPV
ncbi:MAG: glycine/betaine/sarcosine/D-proline family reductase selenoprotein B [Anaerolineae bacterium]|nr:glycine/betaine/sarcosine/D-proline family reductase selenoprotein B [Anaerolineae bacterium]